jgi:SH3-domain binding protein 5
LKEHKEKINALESRISGAKLSYNEALKNLEQISDEIHRMRQERVACREMAHSQTDEDDFLGESRANRIDTNDEYYNFPPKLTTKSSPIRVKSMNQNECPHLLREIELKTATGNYMSTVPTPTNQQPPDPATDEIEQWTEIRLSHSNSSSSQHSAMVTPTLESDTTSLSSDSFASSDSDRNRPHKIVKVTRKVIKNSGEPGDDASTADDKKKSEGLTGWISKSKVQSSNSRRQSFDMLIGDTGDRVKDVFAQGMQRIGKTLERRNSESEIAVTESSNDFFSFSRNDKDGLSDEQVENLLLDQECAEMIQNQGLNISKMN